MREDFHYVMDGEFYARLAKLGMKFERVGLSVAEFRVHEENASMRHLEKTREMDDVLKAERQHIESRAIRRVYGVTLFQDPYVNGWVDGCLWWLARGWKGVLKLFRV